MSQYQQGMTLKALLENPDLLNPPKPNEGSEKLGKKNADDLDAFSSQSAFLVPNLWEKTLPYDGNDFKLEFMDLDEFLNENSLPNEKESTLEKSPPRSLEPQGSLVQMSPQQLGSTVNSSNLLTIGANSPPAQLVNPRTLLPEAPVNASAGSPPHSSPQPSTPGSPSSADVEVDYNLTHTDVVLSTIPEPWARLPDPGHNEDQWCNHQGEDSYDPTKRIFSEEELRPQPMIKKSKKIFVPDDMKDEKYWHRRQKNNIAAKRSRDARRIKENQIALRAAFLEKENTQLRLELEKSRRETKALKKRVQELEGSNPSSVS